MNGRISEPPFRRRKIGSERRKIDRFKERENYLKEKTLEKTENTTKRAHMLAAPSLNDLLKPYFPPVPEIGLPDKIVKREEEGEELKLVEGLAEIIVVYLLLGEIIKIKDTLSEMAKNLGRARKNHISCNRPQTSWSRDALFYTQIRFWKDSS